MCLGLGVHDLDITTRGSNNFKDLILFLGNGQAWQQGFESYTTTLAAIVRRNKFGRYGNFAIDIWRKRFGGIVTRL